MTIALATKVMQVAHLIERTDEQQREWFEQSQGKLWTQLPEAEQLEWMQPANKLYTRRIYNKKRDGKYDPFQHIGPWEHRVRIEKSDFGSFAVASILSRGLAEEILRYGWIIDDHHWHATSLSYVRDDGFTLLLTPQPMSDEEAQNRLDIHVQADDIKSVFKSAKYLKTLLKPFSSWHDVAMGTVHMYSGDDKTGKMTIEANGNRLLVNYNNDFGAFVDGRHRITVSAVKALLNRDMDPGEQFFARFLGPRGYYKGVFEVCPDYRMNSDLMLYEGKLGITSQGFTFAILHEIQRGVAFTDIQFLSFAGCYQSLRRWNIAYLTYMRDSVSDEDKLQSMLRKFNEADLNPEQPEESKLDWVVQRHLDRGQKILDWPGLYRRIRLMLAKRIQETYTRGRVMIPESEGGRFYIQLDPTCFDRNGKITGPGVLGVGEIFLPGIDYEGQVIAWRQPVANQREIVRGLYAIKNEILYREYNNSPCVYVSWFDLERIMAQAGGADQDDSLVITWAPDVVAEMSQFLDAHPFPDTEGWNQPVEPGFRFDPANPFFSDELSRWPAIKYNKESLVDAMKILESVNTDIGQIVDRIMVDILLSMHRESILQQVAGDKKVKKSFLKKLHSQPDYQLKYVSAHLEKYIDSVKQEGGQIAAQLEQQLKAFEDSLLVFPRAFLRGGFRGNGRMPKLRRRENPPIVVTTPLCEALDDLTVHEAQLEENLLYREWLVFKTSESIKTLLTHLGTFPVHPFAEDLAKSMGMIFHRLMDENLTVHHMSEAKAFHRAQGDLFKLYNDHPLVLDAWVARVQRAYDRQISAPPQGADGKISKFPDGLLWGHHTSEWTLALLDLAGMTYSFIPVEFYRDKRHYRRESIQVSVRDTIVFVSDTSIEIGMALVEDCHHAEMVRGYIQAARINPASKPSVLELPVVNGWASRRQTAKTKDELREWLSHRHEPVMLLPEIYVRGEHSEPAARVKLGDRDFGWIGAEFANLITEPTRGYLAPGGEFHLTVVI